MSASGLAPPGRPIEPIARQGRRRFVVRSISVGAASSALVIALIVSLASLSGLWRGDESVIRGGTTEVERPGGGAILRDAVEEFDLEDPVRVLDRICEVTNTARIDVRCHQPLPLRKQRRLEAALASPATGGVSAGLQFVSIGRNPFLEVLARRSILILGPVDRRGTRATAGLLLPPEVFGSIRYVGQRYRLEIDEAGTWTVLGRECAAGCT